ncbi:hypothetical protein [Mycolicibacter arupensis]|jgi:hypothetical protein|uniref:Uncharacterized protein n=1 Tax=Mycolicibacter arupensis TaxID=342002 RepID=A0A5C7XLL9_9MYCO|nr:hypothetical protein [Mycolicibacter arupensis]TXI50196.1 MAG: hypothetical protein E6Q54_21750 [Mycolicibacter arupensis]
MLTPEEQRDLDGVHGALSLATAYHHGDANTVMAVMKLHQQDAVPLVLGLLGAFDSLLRSVPGEPTEILAILRSVAFQAEAAHGGEQP